MLIYARCSSVRGSCSCGWLVWRRVKDFNFGCNRNFFSAQMFVSSDVSDIWLQRQVNVAAVVTDQD